MRYSKGSIYLVRLSPSSHTHWKKRVWKAPPLPRLGLGLKRTVQSNLLICCDVSFALSILVENGASCSWRHGKHSFRTVYLFFQHHIRFSLIGSFRCQFAHVWPASEMRLMRWYKRWLWMSRLCQTDIGEDYSSPIWFSSRNKHLCTIIDHLDSSIIVKWFFFLTSLNFSDGWVYRGDYPTRHPACW